MLLFQEFFLLAVRIPQSIAVLLKPPVLLFNLSSPSKKKREKNLCFTYFLKEISLVRRVTMLRFFFFQKPNILRRKNFSGKSIIFFFHFFFAKNENLVTF